MIEDIKIKSWLFVIIVICDSPVIANWSSGTELTEISPQTWLTPLYVCKCWHWVEIMNFEVETDC